jgi:hypothetical protein
MRLVQGEVFKLDVSDLQFDERPALKDIPPAMPAALPPGDAAFRKEPLPRRPPGRNLRDLRGLANPATCSLDVKKPGDSHRLSEVACGGEMLES